MEVWPTLSAIEPTYISIEIRMKCENSKMSEEVPEADRLRLRPYSLDDERALYEVFADPYARTFYPEMAEAARACLDFGFSHTPCESICSIVRPSNIASCAVAARIHRARREFMRGGIPAVLYYTTRLHWQNSRMDS